MHSLSNGVCMEYLKAFHNGDCLPKEFYINSDHSILNSLIIVSGHGVMALARDAVELVRGGSSRVREDNLCAGCCRVEGFRGWV